MISSLATLIGFTFLGLYGVIIPAITPAQVLLVLGLCAVFTFGIDIPKRYAFSRFGL